MQPAIQELSVIAETLDDSLSDDQLARATAAIDQLRAPVSEDDVRGLIALLPPNGDTASGLNWAILHTIEASKHWPTWDQLDDERHEWKRILKLRLKNAGERPPHLRAV